MVLLLATIYFVLFGWLASKNFKTAVGLFILILPFYFIRFNIGFLPTTALEWSFGALCLVWLIKYSRAGVVEIKYFYQTNKYFCWFVLAFLFFSTVGIFVSEQKIQSLGIWRAYFLEPILFFVILISQRQSINKKDIIWWLSLSTASISLLAIIQKFTGQLYSPTLQIEDLHGRVTSFFTTPNAIGLYVAPIIPLMFYGLKDSEKKKYYIVILALALVSIGLSFSEGALVALAIGVLVALFMLGHKKIVDRIVGLIVIGLFLIMPLRQNLLFQSRSGHNRLVIWGYTWNYLVESPKNFVFGAGIAQWFERVQKPVNDFKKIEPLIYPHNIFLNFWSEIGLFGVVSFVGLYAWMLKISFRFYSKEKFIAVALFSALVIFLVHGLVDVPYFKNDLSFLWWLLVATIII